MKKGEATTAGCPQRPQKKAKEKEMQEATASLAFAK